MAFPKDISKIKTNLTRSGLLSIMAALENKKVKWLDTSLYVGSCTATFEYNGIKYQMSEWFEEVTSIRRIHGKF